MGISRSAGSLAVVCWVDLAVVGNCGAREGSARSAAGGRHHLHVVFLRRDQYRHDGGHVPHRGNSPPAHELRRECDDYDDGVARPALECQTPSIEFLLVEGDRTVPNETGSRQEDIFMVRTVGSTSCRVEVGTWGFPAFVLHIGATVLLNGRSRYGSRNCNYSRTRGNSRRGVGWRSRHGSLRGSCEAQGLCREHL